MSIACFLANLRLLLSDLSWMRCNFLSSVKLLLDLALSDAAFWAFSCSRNHKRRPKSKLVACPEEVRQTLMSDQVISTIRDMLKNTTPVKKGLITKVNKPTLLQNTPEWTRAPRTKPAQKKVLQLESPESFESEDYDSSSHSDELNEDYFELPPIEPSPFATNCDHCERHSTTAKVELACVYCEELFLCFSCKSNPKIIQDHMKKHQNDEGRATRKRKRC